MDTKGWMTKYLYILDDPQNPMSIEASSHHLYLSTTVQPTINELCFSLLFFAAFEYCIISDSVWKRFMSRISMTILIVTGDHLNHHESFSSNQFVTNVDLAI